MDRAELHELLKSQEPEEALCGIWIRHGWCYKINLVYLSWFTSIYNDLYTSIVICTRLQEDQQGILKKIRCWHKTGSWHAKSKCCNTKCKDWQHKHFLRKVVCYKCDHLRSVTSQDDWKPPEPDSLDASADRFLVLIAVDSTCLPRKWVVNWRPGVWTQDGFRMCHSFLLNSFWTLWWSWTV